MQALLAPRLFDGDRWHQDSALLLEAGSITAVVSRTQIPDAATRTEFDRGLLVPGFIDLQVNGGGGVMFNNAPTTEALASMADAHRATGTTAMLPTLLSDTPAVQRAGVAAVREAMAAGHASVLGIHLEGPFFALPRRGTHRADRVRAPQSTDIAWLESIAAEVLTLVTLAPECMPAGAIARLCSAGVIVSAGHTDATWEQVDAARAEGLRGFTHLFNAMSPPTARAPGVVGAALASDDCWAGLIADGHHLHPASLRLALRALPADKACLVSDAMATVGSDSDSFELYGEQITAREGRLVNSEGALAGSAIGMSDAVQYCHTTLGVPLAQCLRMASLNPATFLGLDDRLGRLAPGYRADVLRLDQSGRVLDSWVAGDHQQH